MTTPTDLSDLTHPDTAEPYQLTRRDIEGCISVLAELLDCEKVTGWHEAGSIQAHRQSATVTIRFEKNAGPLATSDAAVKIVGAAGRLALVCNKVIAHALSRPGDIADGPDAA